MPQRYFEAFVLQNFLNGDQLPGLRHSRLKYNSKRAISDNPLGRVADCLALENIHYELKAIMQMRSPARTTATHVCRCLAWHQVRAFLVVHLVVNSNGWDYWLDTSQGIVNFENGSTVGDFPTFRLYFSFFPDFRLQGKFFPAFRLKGNFPVPISG